MHRRSWLPEPYRDLWRSYSSRSDPPHDHEVPHGASGMHTASEQRRQQKQLESMLLGSFQQDAKGTSELLARTLDSRTQRVLITAFAEQPSLSRHRLVPPEDHPEVDALVVEAGPAPPTWSQLVSVAVTKGLPFVAFGFFDNLIMITAGEQIDILLGAKLNLSSMAAAGLGNTVADVVGINISTSIENYFKGKDSMSVALTKAQWHMPQTRRAKWLGCGVGMAVGCLLGLTPLLIWPAHPAHPAKASPDPQAAAAEEAGSS